ncbi:MAG: helix-turn-helix transcriptional regulator, partial [Eubacteriales bacterium]|nr:helix-turn-helix transcriptional regulator [Eubacteriales bacterium]
LSLRMSHALQVLQAQPDLAIADLARQCGFNSASYFASSFKRYYGVTPSSYRLRRLSGDDDGCEAPSPASESL